MEIQRIEKYKHITAQVIAVRQADIMAKYTVEELLKMDTYQANIDANDQARRELLAEADDKEYESMKTHFEQGWRTTGYRAGYHPQHGACNYREAEYKIMQKFQREEANYQAECEDIKERGADIPENYGTRQCKHGVTITEFDCDCAQCEGE